MCNHVCVCVCVCTATTMIQGSKVGALSKLCTQNINKRCLQVLTKTYNICFASNASYLSLLVFYLKANRQKCVFVLIAVTTICRHITW